MAAALHAKILAEGYTPGMLRAAGAATTEVATVLQQHFMKLTAPQRLAAPQPQRQKGDYADILGWEEREKEETVVPPPASGHQRLKCLHQVYIESVLAQHHARLRRREFNLAWSKACRRTASSEVQPCPPLLPTKVGSPHEMRSHLLFDIIQGREDETPPLNHPAPQQAASSGYADMPSIGDIEESGARPQGSPTSFIDNDGLEWPLPPRECLVSPFAHGVPAHRTTPPTPVKSAPIPACATAESVDFLKVSPASVTESDGFEWPLTFRERMVSPDLDMSSARGVQAPTRSDRPSGRPPPLECDIRGTSPASSSSSSAPPLTPIGADDEYHKPSAAPLGVGVIGEGRPTRLVDAQREESTADKMESSPAKYTGRRVTEECIASIPSFPADTAEEIRSTGTPPAMDEDGWTRHWWML
ncbi:hypothetical protein C8T65DRAFT_693287 [Cerioporus squamosus]|nr:hypothetical protein C8T65DRAFT_693287 [Cerioporus squamosus]